MLVGCLGGVRCFVRVGTGTGQTGGAPDRTEDVSMVRSTGFTRALDARPPLEDISACLRCAEGLGSCIKQ